MSKETRIKTVGEFDKERKWKYIWLLLFMSCSLLLLNVNSNNNSKSVNDNVFQYTDEKFISFTHYPKSNHTVVRVIKDNCFEMPSSNNDSRYFLCNEKGEDPNKQLKTPKALPNNLSEAYELGYLSKDKNIEYWFNVCDNKYYFECGLVDDKIDLRITSFYNNISQVLEYNYSENWNVHGDCKDVFDNETKEFAYLCNYREGGNIFTKIYVFSPLTGPLTSRGTVNNISTIGILK